MRIISERSLREYWQQHANAESSMREFIKVVKQFNWTSFVDVREVFASADYHNGFVIFNVGGNNFRIIGIIEYRIHIVFISSVLSHSEYNVHQNWCDCGQKSNKS
jgi:mRNA interferase HigB